MSGSLLDLDVARGGAVASDVSIETLRPAKIMAFLSFLRRVFPGDWNTAARNKIRGGGLADILVASIGDRVVGYCQWESDGHFGPFGVDGSLRGKGVGAALFLEACRRMKAADVRNVWFNWADPDAARFYRRLDLQQTRRFAIMRKDL